MNIQSIGHIVLKVRDLERAATFYRDILGMREVMRYGGKMAFFAFTQNHHDLGLLEVGRNAPASAPGSVGLYHVAFKVGDSLDELRTWKQYLDQLGILLIGMSDHGVSQSLYLADPDGNEIELYVDTDPDLWRNQVETVMTTRPLRL